MAPEAGRLGDNSKVSGDGHGCPACPHTAVGPAILGSPNVYVNGKPALRVDDKGVHAACCGPNMWTATAGAPHVFINGKKAHRKGDEDAHCGATGQLIQGSGNVFVGNGGGGGSGARPKASSSAKGLSDAQKMTVFEGVLAGGIAGAGAFAALSPKKFASMVSKALTSKLKKYIGPVGKRFADTFINAALEGRLPTPAELEGAAIGGFADSLGDIAGSAVGEALEGVDLPAALKNGVKSFTTAAVSNSVQTLIDDPGNLDKWSEAFGGATVSGFTSVVGTHVEEGMRAILPKPGTDGLTGFGNLICQHLPATIGSAVGSGLQSAILPKDD